MNRQGDEITIRKVMKLRPAEVDKALYAYAKLQTGSANGYDVKDIRLSQTTFSAYNPILTTICSTLAALPQG